MATKSSNIIATDLDFDAIATNIKTYLKGQEKFKDYNFEGSNLNVLIDMLAYAQHVGGINTNIAASELISHRCKHVADFVRWVDFCIECFC